AAPLSASPPLAPPRTQAPAPPSAPPPAGAPSFLRSDRIWYPPDGPIWIEVTRPEGSPPLDLVLIARNGTVLGSTPIDAGRYDAIKMIPQIYPIERAAWLQLLAGGSPVGQPMVIVPLRTPPPCRTMIATRPDGTTRYTRVIGWGDQLLDASDASAAALKSSWIDGDAPVTSGWRVSPDRDALLHTEAGTIRVAFSPDAAPATVWNFLTLAHEGYFDDTVFHRVVPLDREGRPFVIQGGDPTSTGDGGPGYNLALEPSDLPHDFGVISMARADEPHSAGSQFFFALSREGTARLDGQYCAFGFAVDGRDAILAMAQSPIQDVRTGRPQQPPRLRAVELVPAPPRTPGTDRRDQRLSREPPPPATPPER
ncbi:MAG: peptidylprolyl isomerase, partial [Phycisphaerae bacterium]|nr:peptidylprolyl isomerase [Phycisphaerae bacterium]